MLKHNRMYCRCTFFSTFPSIWLQWLQPSKLLIQGKLEESQKSMLAERNKIDVLEKERKSGEWLLMWKILVKSFDCFCT